MSLRIALLALLTSEPLTGYELQRFFQRSTGNLWAASDAQIYPELNRMEHAGLICGTEEVRKGRPAKRYELSESGRSVLDQWANGPLIQNDHEQRNNVRLRASYLEWASPEIAKEVLRSHIEHHQSRIATFQAISDAVRRFYDPEWRDPNTQESALARRLEGSPPEAQRRIIAFKLFAFDGVISASRAEVSWAKRGLKLLRELEKGEPSL